MIDYELSKIIKRVASIIEARRNAAKSDRLSFNSFDLEEKSGISQEDWETVLDILCEDKIINIVKSYQDRVEGLYSDSPFRSGFPITCYEIEVISNPDEYLVSVKNILLGRKNLIAKETEQENWYIPNTGWGRIKGKVFRLKRDDQPYKLFNQATLLKELERSKVIETLGLDKKDSRGPYNRDHSINTYTINETVKQIRKTTGLTASQFVNNGGNIILTLQVENKEPS